jgi:hypothetical protein
MFPESFGPLPPLNPAVAYVAGVTLPLVIVPVFSVELPPVIPVTVRVEPLKSIT